MTHRLTFITAGWLTLFGLLCAAGAGQPPPGTKVDEKGIFIPIPKSDNRVDREWLEYALKQQKKAKKKLKVNGVEMDVTVETIHKNNKATDFEFTWTLTYTGPRSPLIILEPSLTHPSMGQTYVRFFAFPKDAKQGRAAAHISPTYWDLQKPGEFPPKLEDLRKQWKFVTIEKGKSATGTTTFPVETLKKRLLTEYPKEFVADTPPELWVKFFHRPSDRAEFKSLDAWTGELWTPILTVPELKGW
ncbi:MAG: hypothetical protein L0241_00730 [Planctomycetia bacterium]|nr:hypothetical protein [Planctomycetia bacterium]